MRLWNWQKAAVGLALGMVWLPPAQAGMIGPSLQGYLSQASPNQKLPVIIALKQQADNVALERACADKTKEQRWGYVVSELKRLSDVTQRDLLTYLASEERSGKAVKVNGFWIVNAVYCEATPEVIQALVKRPEVYYADYDLIYSPNILNLDKAGRATGAGSEKPPRVNLREWNVTIVGADSVWRLLGNYGEGVIVGEIDTGMNYLHWDLRNHLWTSAQYPNPGWNFEFNNNDPMDINGHGTHVAGTVSSDGSAGDTCGMAPRARNMICRVRTQADSIAENQVWAAQQFCVAPPLDPTNHAQLITMSLGWMYAWAPRLALWRQSVTSVATAGLPFLIAAGNERSTPPPQSLRVPGSVPGPWKHPAEAPGGLGGAISIAATDLNDVIATFSSQGPVTWSTVPPYNDYPNPPGLIKPDVAAPGVNITSCDYANVSGYASGWSGTSMATPCVAGVVALMLKKNPNLLPWQVDSLLQMNVRPLGAQPKNNDFGTGRISAYKAVFNTPGPYAQFMLNAVAADTVAPTSSVVDSITVTSITNFNSPVTMTLDSIRPPTGTIAVAFAPNPVTPPPNGSIKTGMRITTTATPSNNYALYYHGTGDTITRRGSLNLWVTAPTFVIQSTPRVQTVFTGDSTSFADTLVSISGFNSPCTLSATVSPPAPSITVSFIPNNIVIPTDGRRMKVQTTTGTPNGGYAITITARSGATVKTLDDSLYVKYSVQGPDPYGYYAYDNTDVGFLNSPVYNWIELNPARGGTGTAGPQGDDANMLLPAGIRARAYGTHANNITMCTNGFVAINTAGVASPYTNAALPSASFVANGVAVFWDDLNVTAPGTTWYRSDANQRFIAEWDSVPLYRGGQSGSYEVIVYDTSLTPGTAATRDCEVVLQWRNVADISSMTVGQQNMALNVGLNSFFNGTYDPQMAAITGGRATKYTTDPPRPISGVELNPLVAPAMPLRFALGPAVPNPSRGGTMISYDLPTETQVSLKVYNLSGQLVRTLVSSKEKAGYKQVTWDGRSEAGSHVSSGVYFYRMDTGSFAATKKLVVVR